MTDDETPAPATPPPTDPGTVGIPTRILWVIIAVLAGGPLAGGALSGIGGPPGAQVELQLSAQKADLERQIAAVEATAVDRAVQRCQSDRREDMTDLKLYLDTRFAAIDTAIARIDRQAQP